MEIDTLGGAAAILTTTCNVPQLKKCWDTGSAGDISLKMLLALASGVALWIVYGVMKQDIVIVAGNAASLLLVLGILWFRLRDPGPSAGDQSQRS